MDPYLMEVVPWAAAHAGQRLVVEMLKVLAAILAVYALPLFALVVALARKHFLPLLHVWLTLVVLVPVLPQQSHHPLHPC